LNSNSGIKDLTEIVKQMITEENGLEEADEKSLKSRKL